MKQLTNSKSPYTFTTDEYMKSEAWARKRQERLKLDGYRCRICGAYASRETPLQVHHLAGAYDKIPKEGMEDLMTLCSACHKDLHAILNKRRRTWKTRNRKGRSPK